MYWWCHDCGVWRIDTHVRIDPRTRAPQCRYCDAWLRERVSDAEYNKLRAEHPLGVPGPTALCQGDI
jgi:hypothetical protein